MTRPAVLSPGCKINLNLRILARRDDGMHEIQTLFYPLPEPSDTLTIAERPAAQKTGLQFSCSTPGLECGDNLVVRAWEAFAETSGLEPSLSVHLDKGVPMGAGLGGGSADAAAMLLHLNWLAGREGLALAPEHLAEMALGLGADVPFFLQQQPCFATGVGETLSPAPEVSDWLSGWWIVVAMPGIHVATGWAYGAWDELNAATPGGLTAFDAQAIDPFCPEGLTLYNSFEAVVLPAWPKLRSLKDFFLRCGAEGALMSGSGSSVFALFREQRAAQLARQELAATAVACVCVPA